MLLRCFFGLGLYIVSACIFLSAAATNIAVNVQMDSVNTSEQQQQVLETLLTRTLKTEVSLRFLDNANFSIQVTTASEPETGWFRSQYQIPPIPAFAKYELKGTRENAVGLVGVASRPYQLQTSSPQYVLADNGSALALLERGRVDSIIDYADNAALYTMDNDNIVFDIIAEEQAVYVDFSSYADKFSFEQNIMSWPRDKEPLLLINPSAQTANIKADINWVILNKFFNAQTDSLEPSAEDVKVTQWFTSELNEYEINMQNTSSSLAFESMSKNDNVCVLNVNKTEQRLQGAIFSAPSVYYLDIRAYALAASNRSEALKESLMKGTLDLETWLNTNNRMLLGYDDLVAAMLKKYVDNLEQDERLINVEGFSANRIVGLLNRQRIDLLLVYPTRLKEARMRENENTPIVSLGVKGSQDPYPAYVACSRSDIGERIVAKINAMLQNPEKARQLAGLYAEWLTESEALILNEYFLSGSQNTQ